MTKNGKFTRGCYSFLATILLGKQVFIDTFRALRQHLCHLFGPKIDEITEILAADFLDDLYARYSGRECLNILTNVDACSLEEIRDIDIFINNLPPKLLEMGLASHEIDTIVILVEARRF
jgi:hypothetical protein